MQKRGSWAWVEWLLLVVHVDGRVPHRGFVEVYIERE